VSLEGQLVAVEAERQSGGLGQLGWTHGRHLEQLGHDPFDIEYISPSVTDGDAVEMCAGELFGSGSSGHVL
jgi:hypothetical protein